MSTTVAENDQQSEDKQKKAQKSRGRIKGVAGGFKGAGIGENLGKRFGNAGARIGKFGGAGVGAVLGKRRGEKQAAKKEAKEQEQDKRTQDSRFKRHVKELGKHIVKEGLKKAARTIARNPAVMSATFGLSIVVVEAVIHWKWTLYAALGVVLFFVFILAGDSASGGAYQQLALQGQPQPGQQQPDEPTVTETCTPATLAKSGDITTCEIDVTYAGSADDIQVIDTIVSLSGSNYVAGSSVPPAAFDNSTGTLLWDAKQLKLQLNPVNFRVSFKLISTKDNWTIYNHYSITPTNLSKGGVVATSNNCGGKYTSDMSNNFLLGKNFGDPQCTMLSNNDFATYLKEQDPANGAKWFLVVQCESGYDPNAWNNPNHVDSQGNKTPDAAGAWGLFQIGSSAIMTPASLYGNNGRPAVTTANVQQQPGLPMPTWGNGGANDRGDVDWETQVQNAIKLLKSRGWGYWACS